MSQDQLRQSQVIAPNGVGAIFDVSGQSFVVESTATWFHQQSTKIEVQSPRLSSALRISKFYSPPSDDPDLRFASSRGQRLPVIRFPAWLFCGACRQMVSWSSSKEDHNPGAVCMTCKIEKKKHFQLVPMRWVQICESGHLGDVDWRWFAHSSTRGSCEKRDGLRFQSSGGTGAGLASVEVRCGYCRSGRSLADISDPQLATRLGLRCVGRHPWDRWEKGTVPACDQAPRVVQRRASNVYYPEVHSAIEVPYVTPDLSPADRAVVDHPFFKGVVDAAVQDDEVRALSLAEMLAPMLHRSAQEILALAKGQSGLTGNAKEAASPNTLDEIAESEWAAFTNAEPFNTDDFRTRITSLADITNGSTSAALAAIVTRVTLADALREVRAFSGFRRVTPGVESVFVRADGRGQHERPLPSWLPAIEVRGEGIFLSLDEAALSKWESEPHVADRVAGLADKAARSFLWSRLGKHTGPSVSARYVMLHTLAHLLIRRLSFESGYGASSLRERVFARTTSTGEAMFGGILIYTAAGDAEGTLGGLVRQGEPARLTPALLGALDDAAWCSADPLCSEQHAVSLDGLNLASCHACTLVSETSCENGNFLLDRTLVVGSDSVPGFFTPVLEAAAHPRTR
ncbi:DrmB family protein [Clavibacter zhangzhiyongii]|uniref:DrmB family protein n=1 Tax=Clavibacter TaxID=1573 RepID=UPI0039DFB0ED